MAVNVSLAVPCGSMWSWENNRLLVFISEKQIKSTGSLLAKSIDCSHNLTHLRVRTSTTGICGVSADAWHKCAKSNETILKKILCRRFVRQAKCAKCPDTFFRGS